MSGRRLFDIMLPIVLGVPVLTLAYNGFIANKEAKHRIAYHRRLDQARGMIGLCMERGLDGETSGSLTLFTPEAIAAQVPPETAPLPEAAKEGNRFTVVRQGNQWFAIAQEPAHESDYETALETLSAGRPDQLPTLKYDPTNGTFSPGLTIETNFYDK